MSTYTNAINAALGVPVAPVAPGTPNTQWREQAKSAFKRTRTILRDTGKLYAETYNGFLFVVREFGVSTICEPAPAPNSYWCVYFTDDELKLEIDVDNLGPFDARVQACRNAIDRMLAGTPVWTDPWYRRFDGLTVQ